ncbi:MAG: DUF3313 domain-containing protein [Mesorhizobium sp.]|nr:MAG: DUF3313 domain-containing protein [Mesorhizobium sp.]
MAACLRSRRGAHISRGPADPRACRADHRMIWPFVLVLSTLAVGCASAPLDQAGSLQSYDELKPSDGLLARSLMRVSKDDVLAAKTVRIIPTGFSQPAAGKSTLTPAQRGLIANAVDRTLCAGLSERFQVVGLTEPADLTVHAMVTHAAPTNALAAGVSKVASTAVSVALPEMHVPVPRLPIGLGSLSLEVEAIGDNGNQAAAMIWGRGANALLDSGRVAREGDAYDLAAKFGHDFSKLLVTGNTPFGKLPSLPTRAELRAMVGGGPKYPACRAFGKSPGLVGFLGDRMGLPPAWTDNGAAVRDD